MADKKSAEELYDLQNNPYELHNLAQDSKYETESLRLRSYMEKWQHQYTDYGLKDLKTRKTENKGSVSNYVKKAHSEAWKKIESGKICLKYREYVNKMRQQSGKKK